MAVKVEDAGFEIRDQIMWVYGSGFPKSHNVGKAVDKILGNEREIISIKPNHKKGMNFKYDNDTGGWLANDEIVETKGSSEWEGFGTALKPAHEPIVMARKPFKGSVAKNVLKWSTGGININDCRIGNEIMINQPAGNNAVYNSTWKGVKTHNTISEGRFPANIIFDEEAGELLDKQSGILKSGKLKITHKRHTNGSPNGIYGKFNPEHPLSETYGDKGGASRFFYCAKANKEEREEGLISEPIKIKDTDDGQDNRNVPQKLSTTKGKNTHTTVKPVSLMQYLIRLVTPKNGTTIDPFFGSGTSGKSTIIIEGNYKFIGIEKEKEYFDIAVERCQYEYKKSLKVAA
jgi:site-specific DNA-methyltransferase (adenine-specific)